MKIKVKFLATKMFHVAKRYVQFTLCINHKFFCINNSLLRALMYTLSFRMNGAESNKIGARFRNAA